MPLIVFVAIVLGGMYWLSRLGPGGGPDALRIQRFRQTAQILTALEVLLFGCILVRLPFLRTPVGLLVAVPAGFIAHRWLAREVGRRFGHLNGHEISHQAGRPLVQPASRRIAPPGETRMIEFFSRHFYLLLGFLYLVVTMAILFLYRMTPSLK